MTAIDVLVNNIESSLNWLKWTIGDISDAELMTRPCERANHAKWQLGQIVSGCNYMMKVAGGKPVELPAGFDDKYSNKTTSVDDPSQFHGKDELIALLEKTHAAAVAGLRTLKPEDLDKPSPAEFKDYAPTVAAVALLLGQHIQMHMGQIQVIRRKLGKPVLF